MESTTTSVKSVHRRQVPSARHIPGRSGLRLLGRMLPLVAAYIGVSACVVRSAGADPPQCEQDTPVTRSAWYAAESSTWVATDALDRTLPTYSEVGAPRSDRFVGIFYLLWHGEHGTDGPFDINLIQSNHPYNPGTPLGDYLDALEPYYGPFAFDDADGDGEPDLSGHHWGEPLFGYYRADDEYVLRKHLQMLVDAGVDVLLLDNTNAVPYDANVTRLLSLAEEIRESGGDTPQFAFMAHPNIVEHDYDSIYAPGHYADLWFYWRGKPLLLVTAELSSDVPQHIRDFFTIRTSWSCGVLNNDPCDWYGDGQNNWAFIYHYPQAWGWDSAPMIPEQIAVATAEHAHLNVGKSFHDGTQPAYGSAAEDTARGYYFEEQIQRALDVDPEFALITQWNEWIAGRLEAEEDSWFLGVPREPGESFFVDAYNHEFNRDIEPVVGGHGDNYVYQMTDFIRRFKGAAPSPAPGQPRSIDIDGAFADWNAVGPRYLDQPGDEPYRLNQPGYFQAGPYTNLSGRNDIVEARVTYDECDVFFYARTQQPLSTYSAQDWMVLYIDVDSDHATGWEGFDYVVNRVGVGATTSTLEANTGGWNWSHVGAVTYRASGNELELAIPRDAIGETDVGVAIDFKWADNTQPAGDVLRFTTHGDCAPNDRYKYRYVNSLPGGPCEPGCEGVDVWVDFDYVGPEDGSYGRPFNTLTEAVSAAPASGTIGIRAGSTSETPTISDPVTILACGGTVTIGAQ